MDKTEEIIEDCPDFMYGCCTKYLDGDCSAHKCDLKIIRELQQKLQAKEQECEQLKAVLQTSDIAKTVISSAEINFPIIEKLSNALDEIDSIADGNLCDKDCDECPDNCMCNWKEIKDIIHKTKDRKNA